MGPIEGRPTVVDDAVVRHWGLIALRGVCGVAFGLIAILDPRIALAALVLVFGVYACSQGVLLVWTAISRHSTMPHWVGALVGGLASIGIGVMAFLWPGITALALLFLIAGWAIVVGISEIATAWRLRKVIENEGLLMFGGVLSVAFGILFVAFPGPGALGLLLWIGAWSLVWGFVLLVAAFRLRSWGLEHHVLGPAQPA